MSSDKLEKELESTGLSRWELLLLGGLLGGWILGSPSLVVRLVSGLEFALASVLLSHDVSPFLKDAAYATPQGELNQSLNLLVDRLGFEPSWYPHCK
jgi:uncharacterized membrane protein (UPF0136 family)